MHLERLTTVAAAAAVVASATATATGGVEETANEKTLLRKLTKYTSTIKFGGGTRKDFTEPAAGVVIDSTSSELGAGEGEVDTTDPDDTDREEEPSEDSEKEDEPWPLLPDVHEESECTADKNSYCQNQYLCSEFTAMHEDIRQQALDYANMDSLQLSAIGTREYEEMLSELAEEEADYKFDMDCYCRLAEDFYNDYCRAAAGFDPNNCNCGFGVIAVDSSDDGNAAEEPEKASTASGGTGGDSASKITGVSNPGGNEDGEKVDKVKEEKELSAEILKLKDMISKLEEKKIKDGKKRDRNLQSLYV